MDQTYPTKAGVFLESVDLHDAACTGTPHLPAGGAACEKYTTKLQSRAKKLPKTKRLVRNMTSQSMIKRIFHVQLLVANMHEGIPC